VIGFPVARKAYSKSAWKRKEKSTMVKVHIIHYWVIDPSAYTDGRWLDKGKEYVLALPAGLSDSRPVMETYMGNGHKSRIVLDGSPDFPTMQEAQQYAEACNKSESWSR